MNILWSEKYGRVVFPPKESPSLNLTLSNFLSLAHESLTLSPALLQSRPIFDIISQQKKNFVRRMW